MKKIVTCFLVFLVLACNRYDDDMLKKDYVLETDAAAWAFNAPDSELCKGLKNWRSPDIRNAALIEVRRRAIDTKKCYDLDGYNLAPTFETPENIRKK